MSDIAWTSDQRSAIGAVGRSLAVTAAAGSGKTAVLAARCAYLICDAPPAVRCGVDRLAVVTFTEAAAGEMKERIRTNLLNRLAAEPGSAYLREQVGFLETAQISTIHAFCLWMVRRWFQRIDVDPASVVLDEDEARILKADVLDQLVGGLYESADDAGTRFRSLVDVYGLGEDAAIREFTLRMADYVESLPDPDGWLDDAVRRLTGGEDRLMRYLLEPLRHELSLQLGHARQFEPLADSTDRCLRFYGDLFAAHTAMLYEWQQAVAAMGETLGTASDAKPSEAIRRFEELRAAVAGYEPSAKGAPRTPKDASAEESERIDAVRAAFQATRASFITRVRERYALFTAEESLKGLDAIVPHAAALVELVRSFREAYRTAKRRADVLDFADQEALAYRLVQDEEIAAALRQRFQHVLVDEYQDISPLQDALLRRVSRDGDAGREPNLFTVGDVKQSIYRFRNADPDVFRERIEQCQADPQRGRVVLLRENFRSRPEILDAVNALFRRLMIRSVGGVDYDDSHALRPGRKVSPDDTRFSIDVHLLDRKVAAAESPDDGEPEDRPVYVDPDDPAEWQAVEREAYVIAGEIQQMMERGMTVGEGRPLSRGDIAVLLRSPVHRGDTMARLLGRMGIKAVSHARGTLFDTTEINDVRALLATLDNAQQDIPLAAVLRSRVLGQPFSEDDLLRIRRLDRRVPFHQAVHRYVAEGSDEGLKSRLSVVLTRLGRWRRAMRERPFAEVLWELLETHGYLAYVGGLVGGAQRRANLIRFHDRATQFGTFRRQGLRRFLAFVERLEEREEDLGSAPTAASPADTVQILSIHAAKGLEFPVVFVADLGRRMNLEDNRGRMVFDRSAGLGLRVVEPDRRIEYPSAASRLVAAEIDRSTRAEELRLLYVALTRARERLILVGSTDLEALASRRRFWSLGANTLTPMAIETAMQPLDWLLPALAAMPDGAVGWPDRPARAPLFQVHAHDGEAMRAWRLAPRGRPEPCAADLAIAELQTLPPDEPRSADPAEAEAIVARIRSDYPHAAAASVRAVFAASEAKRAIDPWSDPDAQTRAGPVALGRPAGGGDRDTAARRGTATHTLLQHFNHAAGVDELSLRAELDRIIASGIVAPEDAALIDLGAVTWFFDTPLGRAVRSAGAQYRREFMFVAAHPADWFDPTLGPDVNERVLVRGVVDGVLPRDGGIEIIDFKTDEIDRENVSARAESYRGQLRLYAASMAPIFRQPVSKCWLVFLHPRETVLVPPDGNGATTAPEASARG